MTRIQPDQHTTLSVLYQQEPDALARVLSVLRRLRIHVEALSAIPAGDGTARAVLLLRSPAYHATRARVLIEALIPVLQVVEIAARDAPPSAAAQSSTNTRSERGATDGDDSL